MKYVRVYSDSNGQARFAELEFTFASRDFAPPAPPVDVSEPIGASSVMMLRLPAGWTDAAHPSPARQLVVVLSGSGEVNASGETRSFSAGDVVLLEDASGAGHGTTVFEDTTLAIVRL